MGKLNAVFVGMLFSLAFGACSEKKPQLSKAQIEHKKDMDRCISMLVQAGTKWYQGDQAVALCEQRYPAPLDLESQ